MMEKSFCFMSESYTNRPTVFFFMSNAKESIIFLFLNQCLSPKMWEVAKAWEILGDPQQRSLYDAQRSTAPAEVGWPKLDSLDYIS